MLDRLIESHQRIIDLPIQPECFLSIVIPIRNESEHLQKTLRSLASQVDFENKRVDFMKFEIIFLVNNSSDESGIILKNWCRGNSFPVIHFAEVNLPPENSNIGYVRRWLMNEAYLRLIGNKFNGGIIATTDGDTEVAPNWIAATLAEIEKGVGAVGGRIYINRADRQNMPLQTRAFHLRDTGYRLMAAEVESVFDFLEFDPPPRHHQHFNGSFAVTTSAFALAGGIPEVRFLEDVAFYKALLRKDIRFRHSPAVHVQTSARPDGRTELGLSTQINEWTIMGQNGDQYLVESVASIIDRLEVRKKLRCLWQNKVSNSALAKEEIKFLADKLFIPSGYLAAQLDTAQSFGSLYEKISDEQLRIGERHIENPLVCVEKAIFDLRLLIERIRPGSKHSQ